MEQMYLVGTQSNKNGISGLSLEKSYMLNATLENQSNNLININSTSKLYDFEKDKVYLINFNKENNNFIFNKILPPMIEKKIKDNQSINDFIGNNCFIDFTFTPSPGMSYPTMVFSSPQVLIKINRYNTDILDPAPLKDEYQIIFQGTLEDLTRSGKITFTPVINFSNSMITIELEWIVTKTIFISNDNSRRIRYRDKKLLTFNDAIKVAINNDTLRKNWQEYLLGEIYIINNSLNEGKIINEVKIEGSQTDNIFLIINEDLFTIDSTGTIILDKDYNVYYIGCFCGYVDKPTTDSNYSFYCFIEYKEVE